MTRFISWLGVVLFCFHLLADEKSPLGKKVESFSLKDFRGRAYSLDDFKDSKLIVVAFLGVDCPLTKVYAARLVTLHDQFSKRKVSFIGINSNSQDAVTKIGEYAKTHKIEFPLLKDVGNKVADLMGAKRTPEVFILDEKREIAYHGRVDDQFGIGFNRSKPQRNDLAIALEELLTGKKVTLAETESQGCHIGRLQDAKADAKITYTKDIAPLLQKRCEECHREGAIAPFALTDYKDVRGWSEMIAEVVTDGRMPPWHANPKVGKFANDRSLSKDEKDLIVGWVKDGAPEGEPTNHPPAKKYIEGWQLPEKPSLVLNIHDKPYRVQAEGEVTYQYITIDPGFKEDKWVKSVEIQAGNLSVVHHVVAFAVENGMPTFGPGFGYLAAYAPGLRPATFPAGMAKKIPAGSKLVFQMHYTPNGSVQFDQSRIAFVFMDKKDVKFEAITTSANNQNFEIPARTANTKVEAYSPAAPIDVQLITLMPHMHLRGKSFQYHAVYPDGKKELLLDVPRFDFNWQTGYQLAEPKKLPKGTRILATGIYDNTAANLNNPNPNVAVRFGEQTHDEMMVGYFEIAVPVK